MTAEVFRHKKLINIEKYNVIKPLVYRCLIHFLVSDNLKHLSTTIRFRDHIVRDPVFKLRTDPGHFSAQLLRVIRNVVRSEEHRSELQSRGHLVCRLMLEKKKITRAR